MESAGRMLRGPEGSIIAGLEKTRKENPNTKAEFGEFDLTAQFNFIEGGTQHLVFVSANEEKEGKKGRMSFKKLGAQEFSANITRVEVPVGTDLPDISTIDRTKCAGITATKIPATEDEEASFKVEWRDEGGKVVKTHTFSKEAFNKHIVPHFRERLGDISELNELLEEGFEEENKTLGAIQKERGVLNQEIQFTQERKDLKDELLG
jgi:hypothetical protein